MTTNAQNLEAPKYSTGRTINLLDHVALDADGVTHGRVVGFRITIEEMELPGEDVRVLFDDGHLEWFDAGDLREIHG